MRLQLPKTTKLIQELIAGGRMTEEAWRLVDQRVHRELATAVAEYLRRARRRSAQSVQQMGG
jgi:hypothetical protein